MQLVKKKLKCEEYILDEQIKCWPMGYIAHLSNTNSDPTS